MTWSKEKFLSLTHEKKIKELFKLAHLIEEGWGELDSKPSTLLETWLDYLNWNQGKWPSSIERLLCHKKSYFEKRDQFLMALVPLEREFYREPYESEKRVKTLDKEKQRLSKTMPVVVVMENFRSSFNVGSFLRSAEFFAVEKVICSGYTPTPENIKVKRASLGAEESVLWEHHKNLKQVIDEYKSQGYFVVGLETTEGSESFSSWQRRWDRNSILLLFGNERFGLSYEALESCDLVLEIPSRGIKNSLNVAVCGGIVLQNLSYLFDQL